MVKDGRERDYVAVVPSDITVPVNGVQVVGGGDLEKNRDRAFSGGRLL